MRMLSTVTGSILVLGMIGFSTGCADDSDDVTEVDLGEGDLTSSLSLKPGTTSKFSFTSTGKAMVVAVDCAPPIGPDDVGPVFQVNSTALAKGDPPRAGSWTWAGTLPAGKYSVDLVNKGGSAKCAIRVNDQSPTAVCKAYTIHRSPNLNHNHFKVGTDTSADWEKFPTSGNHWGAWAAWNKVYPKAIKKAFLLHNLEHGGLILSYKCAANDTADCKKQEAALLEVANQAGLGRVIITPDPTQPTMFAIRSWRWGYQSNCIEKATAVKFMKDHIRHGREDIDADPPLPFDPTTTNVPCQNLMAAPDSC